MSTEIPIESVSGKDGWEWNKWRKELQSGKPTSGSYRKQFSGDRLSSLTNDNFAQDADSGQNYVECRNKLRQKEKRIQSLINQYERVIKQKDEKISNSTQTEEGNQGLISVLTDRIL